MTLTEAAPRRTRQKPLPRTAAGRPVRSALARAPFVFALIAVLAFGVAGVLYLNAKIDESGIRTENALFESRQLRLEIEELTRSVAELSATPRLAQAAEELGLVPVGDAAMLQIGADGSVNIQGEPRTAGDRDQEGTTP